MARSNRYRCLIRWTHRKYGPSSTKVSAEGTSIRRAINNALLGFFSPSSSEHRDAHAEIQVHCWRVKSPPSI